MYEEEILEIELNSTYFINLYFINWYKIIYMIKK